MIIARFFKEIFQDHEDGFSSKRAAVIFMIALITVFAVAAVFFGYNVPELIWNGLIDLVKWIFAFILGEKTPSALLAWNGKTNGPKSVFATDEDEPATIVDPDK